MAQIGEFQMGLSERGSLQMGVMQESTCEVKVGHIKNRKALLYRLTVAQCTKPAICYLPKYIFCCVLSAQLLLANVCHQPEDIGPSELHAINGPLRTLWSAPGASHASSIPCNSRCRSSLIG